MTKPGPMAWVALDWSPGPDELTTTNRKAIDMTSSSRTSQAFRPGDRVTFARAFVQAVQGHEVAARRGTVRLVQHMGPVTLVYVAWADGPVRPVLAANLVHLDRLHLEAV